MPSPCRHLPALPPAHRRLHIPHLNQVLRVYHLVGGIARHRERASLARRRHRRGGGCDDRVREPAESRGSHSRSRLKLGRRAGGSGERRAGEVRQDRIQRSCRLDGPRDGGRGERVEKRKGREEEEEGREEAEARRVLEPGRALIGPRGAVMTSDSRPRGAGWQPGRPEDDAEIFFLNRVDQSAACNLNVLGAHGAVSTAGTKLAGYQILLSPLRPLFISFGRACRIRGCAVPCQRGVLLATARARARRAPRRPALRGRHPRPT